MNAAQQLQIALGIHSKDELAKQDGMVYQVWQDGEITLQKSGDLLWQRNLHCIEMGINGFEVKGVEWPHTTNGNKFIFTDEAGAKAVRAIIFEARKQ